MCTYFVHTCNKIGYFNYLMYDVDKGYAQNV